MAGLKAAPQAPDSGAIDGVWRQGAAVMVPSAPSLILFSELRNLHTQPVRLGFFVTVAGHLTSDTSRAPS